MIDDFVEHADERREPIVRETTAEKIARIARGDLTPDEQHVLRRRQGLDLTPGDLALEEGRIMNQQRAAARARIAFDEKKELNRMQREARRLLRFGVDTTVSDAMRAQELRDLERRPPIPSDEDPLQRRERLRSVRERLAQSALRFD